MPTHLLLRQLDEVNVPSRGLEVPLSRRARLAEPHDNEREPNADPPLQREDVVEPLAPVLLFGVAASFKEALAEELLPQHLTALRRNDALVLRIKVEDLVDDAGRIQELTHGLTRDLSARHAVGLFRMLVRLHFDEVDRGAAVGVVHDTEQIRTGSIIDKLKPATGVRTVDADDERARVPAAVPRGRHKGTDEPLGTALIERRPGDPLRDQGEEPIRKERAEI